MKGKMKMPCRYIREEYLTSEHVDMLDVHAERFYFRLFLVVDDFGRFDANAKILRSKCYPLKDDIRTADISRWLAACEKAGLILLYTAAGKQYLSVNRFSQTRANCRSSKSKYPDPPNDVCGLQAPANNLQASANNLKASAAENENENENENESERDARPREDSPEKNISGSVEVMPYPRMTQDGIRVVKQNAEAIGYSMSDEDAENFIAFYESTGWTRNGQKIRRWPSLLVKWRNVARNDAKEKGGKKNADCREITLDAAEYFKKPF